MAYLDTYEVADAAVTKLVAHPTLSGAFRVKRADETLDTLREESMASAGKGELWVRASEDEEPEIAGINAGVPDYVRPVLLEIALTTSRKRARATVKTYKAAVEEALLGVTLTGTHEPLELRSGWLDDSDPADDLHQTWVLALGTLYDDARASVGYAGTAGSPIGLLLALTKAA